MLAELQRHLSDIYQADCGHRVTDFVITDRVLAGYVGAQPLHGDVEETVLVAEDGDGLALSVFLDQALLLRLDGVDPMTRLQPDSFADLATVLEGVSHFNYLAWCAAQGKSVTLLELELQAEVDKFVATRFLALTQKDYEFARQLHRWLFDDVSFLSSLDSARRERYETANDYAARFCHRIHDRLTQENGLQELRYFYRLSQAEKISYIHSLAWDERSQSL